MSFNGETILEMLPETSQLSNPDNTMYKLIDRTVGAWLDDFEEHDLDTELFLNTATGKYLDLHGQDYNIRRKINESDTDYRERIIYESLGHLTVNYLRDVYNVELYVYVPDFNVSENSLTSDNPYLNTDSFIGICNQTTRDILDKKFIFDKSIYWLIL